jgi:hypothetical protein
MPCILVYSDGTGHELLRVNDPGDQLPIPQVGDAIRFCLNDCKIESMTAIVTEDPEESTIEHRLYVFIVTEPV